jgi:hypothetical protein
MQIASKQNKHGAALHKVKFVFAWKIWLLSLFLNGKAFVLNNQVILIRGKVLALVVK